MVAQLEIYMDYHTMCVRYLFPWYVKSATDKNEKEQKKQSYAFLPVSSQMLLTRGKDNCDMIKDALLKISDQIKHVRLCGNVSFPVIFFIQTQSFLASTPMMKSPISIFKTPILFLLSYLSFSQSPKIKNETVFLCGNYLQNLMTKTL